MSRTDPAQFSAVPIVEDDRTIGQHLHLGLQAAAIPPPGAGPAQPPSYTSPKPNPKIVFLDLGLPDLDGVERARYVTTAGRICCGHRHGVTTAEPWLILGDPPSRNGAWHRFPIDYLRSGSGGMVVQPRIWPRTTRPSRSGRAQESCSC
jgi:hypothetical protein